MQRNEYLVDHFDQLEVPFLIEQMKRIIIYVFNIDRDKQYTVAFSYEVGKEIPYEIAFITNYDVIIQANIADIIRLSFG